MNHFFHIALLKKNSAFTFKMVVSNLHCLSEKKLKETLVPHSKKLMQNFKNMGLKISFIVMKDSQSSVSGLTMDCKLENSHEGTLELPY